MAIEDLHNGGVECRWVCTNRDSEQIVGYRAMTAGASAIHIGARLFTAQSLPRISEYTEEKRREQTLFECSGKSEAEVTNRRLPSTKAY